MSAASGKPLPSSVLQESNISNTFIPSNVMDTPSKSTSSSSTTNTKLITTPPETLFINRKKQPFLFETPQKPSHLDPNIVFMKSSYLSPAFSSPQQQHQLLFILTSSPIKKTKGLAAAANIEDSSKRASSQLVPPPPATTKKSKSKETPPAPVFDINSNQKPPYSYATLIGISILCHPDKKLTLSQIYHWISDTFKFYKREDMGWQNSIRHNLSLNKAFIKGEKSKDGKGHFWCIKPGCEEQFLKSRSLKKSSYHEVMDQIKQASKFKADKEAQAAEAAKIEAVAAEEGASRREDAKGSDGEGDGEENDTQIDDAPVGKFSCIFSQGSTFRNMPASSPNYTRKRKIRLKKDRHNSNSNHSDRSDYEYDYTDEEIQDDDEDDDENDITRVLDPALKKQQRRNTPLQAPWNSTKLDSAITPNAFNAPQFLITDSPNKPLLAGKNLTYTSSFSCNSNFELSPIRPAATGPLLEPLTPANNNIYQQQQYLHTLQLHHLHLHVRNSLQGGIQSKSRTPKSSNNILKTPLRNIRTPQTNSIIRKLWNSPSYLDDFYYSPLLNNNHQINLLNTSNASVKSTSGSLSSYDDDDMILRNLQHDHVGIQSSPVLDRGTNSTGESDGLQQLEDRNKNLYQDLKKVNDEK